MRQGFANHTCRKRSHLHDVILEAQRPRLARDRTQDNRRIGEAVVFATENELRFGNSARMISAAGPVSFPSLISSERVLGAAWAEGKIASKMANARNRRNEAGEMVRMLVMKMRCLNQPIWIQETFLPWRDSLTRETGSPALGDLMESAMRNPSALPFVGWSDLEKHKLTRAHLRS